jgi:hypothetical protein
MQGAVHEFFEDGMFSPEQKRLCLSLFQKVASCIKTEIKNNEKKYLNYAIETWFILAREDGGTRENLKQRLCRFEQGELYVKCKKSNDVTRCSIKKGCGTVLYKMPFAGNQRICNVCMEEGYGDDYIVDWNWSSFVAEN